MVLLGLLLLVVAIIVAVVAIVRGGQTANIDLHWFTVKTEVAVVFIAGLVCLLIAVIGVWLITKGLQRSRRRRAEINSLRDRAERNDRAQVAPSASATRSEPEGPDITDRQLDPLPRDEHG